MASEPGVGAGAGAGACVCAETVALEWEDGIHWLYHSESTSQVLPAAHSVGPSHSLPPHWPHASAIISDELGAGVGVGSGSGCGSGSGAGVCGETVAVE